MDEISLLGYTKKRQEIITDYSRNLKRGCDLLDICVNQLFVTDNINVINQLYLVYFGSPF